MAPSSTSARRLSTLLLVAPESWLREQSTNAYVSVAVVWIPNDVQRPSGICAFVAIQSDWTQGPVSEEKPVPPRKKPTLKLYEALELRSEYDARIKTLRECLPESRENRGWLRSTRDDEHRRPSPDFDLDAARADIKALELKRRKLNSAIQEANFRHRIEHDGESITLSEALETRKAVNLMIGELHTQVTTSAWQRVIYKEGRDIVEENSVSYAESVARLERERLSFRDLNRKLRAASFDVSIDFHDD